MKYKIVYAKILNDVIYASSEDEAKHIFWLKHPREEIKGIVVEDDQQLSLFDRHEQQFELPLGQCGAV